MAALHIRLSRPLFPKSLLSTYSPSVMLGVRGYSQHTQLHYPTNLEMQETHHLLRLQMSTHWSTLGRKKSNPKLKQNRLLASRSLILGDPTTTCVRDIRAILSHPMQVRFASHSHKRTELCTMPCANSLQTSLGNVIKRP